MNRKVLMVVNKSKGELGPSETFLRAQMNGLPCQIVPLIGNPGLRCRDGVDGRYLMSRSLLSRGLRWLARALGFTTLERQDCVSTTAYLKREGFDAVLAQYGPTAVSIMEACELAGIPLVVHFHGYDAYMKYYLDKYNVQYKKLFKQAAAVVAVSRHMRAQLLKLGAPPDKTIYSSCGAELPDGVAASPDQAGLKYIMVGRLTEKKAPMVSIAAFKQLVSLFPEAILDIIGDGPLRNECEKLSASLDLQKNVNFHGAQPHSEVLRYMSRARCFLQHSVCASSGDREGTPVGVLEAMGIGLPVVATRHGGIMDVIESEDLGILVDEYDMDAMAQAMITLAEDDSRVSRMGKSAREHVMAGWTNQHSVDRLWKVLAGVM